MRFMPSPFRRLTSPFSDARMCVPCDTRKAWVSRLLERREHGRRRHRGRVLLEESRGVRRRARRGRSRDRGQSCPPVDRGPREGERFPTASSRATPGSSRSSSRTRSNGRRERLVYLSRGGDLTAYEELRTGFTAAVSHELRTPLARLLSLLETATLPGEDVAELVEQARAEVEQIRELIDEVLFLCELESGTRVVSLGSVAVKPELEAVAAELEERASRAGVALAVEGDPAIELEIRPRMLRVVAQNLAENAIRYAGPGATFTPRDRARGDEVILRGTDDGVGVREAELRRLFERFYRADRARASRGTGLGLAIVKHIVTQAGGTVEAHGGSAPGSRSAARSRPRRLIAAPHRRVLPVAHQTPTTRPPTVERPARLASTLRLAGEE